MRNEASAALDVRALARRFAEALKEARFDFERPSLAVALRGYEQWLRGPARGFEWGETDCAIVAMEPEVVNGSYEIELRRHVGEILLDDESVGLVLRCDLERSRGLRGLWGHDAGGLRRGAGGLDPRFAPTRAGIRRCAS
jgi:hypothetical protein